MTRPDRAGQKGRRAALVIAGTGIGWVLFGMIADKEGFDVGTRIAGDLVALAGFLFAFWLIFQMWRDGRNDGQ